MSRGGRRVEKGRSIGGVVFAQPLKLWAQLIHRSREHVSLNLGAHEPEALSPAMKVRRRKHACSSSGRCKRRFGKQTRRTLPLRPCNVNHRKAVVGVSQSVEQRANWCQTQALAHEFRALFEVDQRFEVAACGRAVVDGFAQFEGVLKGQLRPLSKECLLGCDVEKRRAVAPATALVLAINVCTLLGLGSRNRSRGIKGRMRPCG